MFGAAPASKYTGVVGWESEHEQSLLVTLARKVSPNGRIVEIGSEYGMSASCLAFGAVKSIEIHCVDLFPVDYRGDFMVMHDANMRLAGLGERVKYHKGDSSEVGKAWQGGAIDLLFVDGDHSKAGVLRDIGAWLPHVKVGGIVVFHDTAAPSNKNVHALHLEVDEALTEWLAEDGHNWRELPPVDSMRVFERLQTNS